VKEFIETARVNLQGVAIATAGPGSSSAMTADLLGVKTGIKIREIPYRGSSAAIPDLIAGRVDAMFIGIPEATSLINDGKIKPLGVTSGERASSLPQVPTIAEAGVPDYLFQGWISLFVPKGTPAEIIGKLNSGFNKAFAVQAFRDRLIELSVQPAAGPSALAGRLLTSDIELWGPILKDQPYSNQ
jgi:tripartite-type tricarboxylate transporter receptor subunit TctC